MKTVDLRGIVPLRMCFGHFIQIFQLIQPIGGFNVHIFYSGLLECSEASRCNISALVTLTATWFSGPFVFLLEMNHITST